MTTRANKPPAPEVNTRQHKPLPEDCGTDIVSGRTGPCYQSEHYAVLATNQIGEVQIHPCRMCHACFTYSEEYGWVRLVEDTPARERAQEIVEQTIAAGVFDPGTFIRR